MSDHIKPPFVATGSITTTGMIAAARVVYGTPIGYRLARRGTCELVLQACYRWIQGREGGSYWEDLPTVNLPQAGEVEG